MITDNLDWKVLARTFCPETLDDNNNTSYIVVCYEVTSLSEWALALEGVPLIKINDKLDCNHFLCLTKQNYFSLYVGYVFFS